MTLELRCPQCNQMLRVGDEAAGKRVRCPKCETIFPVETTGQATAAPPTTPPPAFGAAANQAAFGAPAAPQPTFGAPSPLPVPTEPPPKPASPFGPTPLPPAGGNPFSGPATAPNPFAAPLGSAPPGGNDPSPFAPTKDALNPYASPVQASFTPQVTSIDGRPGLPWEVGPKSPATFFETLKMVLLSPEQAFSSMRLTAPNNDAITYYLWGTVAAVLVQMVWQVPFQIITNPELRREAGGAIGIAGGAFICVPVLVLVFGFIGLFIHSAILHLSLAMVGEGKTGFDATLKVLGYGGASTAWLGVVPCVGPLAVFVWSIIVQTIGLRQVHGCTTGKALLAIFLPMLVCCAVTIGLAVIIAGVAIANR